MTLSCELKVVRSFELVSPKVLFVVIVIIFHVIIVTLYVTLYTREINKSMLKK